MSEIKIGRFFRRRDSIVCAEVSTITGKYYVEVRRSYEPTGSHLIISDWGSVPEILRSSSLIAGPLSQIDTLAAFDLVNRKILQEAAEAANNDS